MKTTRLEFTILGGAAITTATLPFNILRRSRRKRNGAPAQAARPKRSVQKEVRFQHIDPPDVPNPGSRICKESDEDN